TKEDGLNTILKTTLEALIKIERSEHQKKTLDYGNGYRYRKVFGHGKMIELKVPRTREGFYPVILGLYPGKFGNDVFLKTNDPPFFQDDKVCKSDYNFSYPSEEWDVFLLHHNAANGIE